MLNSIYFTGLKRKNLRLSNHFLVTRFGVPVRLAGILQLVMTLSIISYV
jgi:hypothetical protein